MERSVEGKAAVKKFLSLIILLAVMGCTSVSVPNYIKDVNPYEKIFYADFNEVLRATTLALDELGWELTDEVDPAVFERNKEIEEELGRQILLFTEMRQTSLVVGSRYARLNIYLRSGISKSTTVEVRYLTVNSTPVKSFYNYHNDKAVERILSLIEKKLG